MYNTREEILFKNLKECIKELGEYDINAFVPLLYVLVALKHNITVIANIASDKEEANEKSNIQLSKTANATQLPLLEEIRSLVPNSYFEGGYAEVIFDFVKKNIDYFEDFYSDIIEYIISFCTGKYSGIIETPNEVASLMAALTKSQNPNKVFDPCAGLSSYALSPELKDIPFLGYEIDHFTCVLAQIRLDAISKKGNVIQSDAISEWNLDKECDTIVSEPPLGYKIKRSDDDSLPFLMEDYIIYKFINTPSIRKAVIMTSLGAFNRKETVQLRAIISENNWLDSVIKLPKGILPYTSGLATGILVLNKDRETSDVRFVLADDCIKAFFIEKSLDYKAVLERVFGEDKKQSCTADSKELPEHGFSFDPVSYVSERIEVLPGQKIVRFMSLVEKIKGENRFEDMKGRVLQSSHMSSSIADSQTREIIIREQDITHVNLMKVCDRCIIFNVAADKFFIKNDEEPIYISPSYNSFAVKKDKCIPEYLAECVVKAERFRETALKGTGMKRVDYDNLLLPIYENMDSQKQIIQRIYRQEQNVLKRKLESLQVLSGKSSDLIHNLGVTFTKISASIGTLRKHEENDTVDSMYDNVQFALRLINSTGTDFSFVKPELEKTNLFEIMSDYIKAWRNFGFQSFEILPIKTEMPTDTKVMADKNLFYTLLDCIFINAHQHGFNKRLIPDNKVIVMIDGVEYKGNKYARIGISNNGNPLPADFSLEDFISRGIVGINSSQDGLGGDHICKIAHHHGGLVSIESEPDWLTINILIPVYLTSEGTKYNDYECECI